MSDSIVIVPTYNEKENIASIIAAVMELEQPFHVLVVDDNSPDGTAQIVENLQTKYPNALHLLKRQGKNGLGTAYIAGFRWSLEQNYQYIFEMDADFSHPPKDLIRLRECCANQGADMSIGSRYAKGGSTVNWSWDRILLSYGASLYVRLLTLMPIKDPTSGFVCYTNRVLSSIDLQKITFVGYAFQIQMKFAAYTLGYHLREIPITFADRTQGVSKMNLGIIQEAIFGVIKMRWGVFWESYLKK